MTHSVARPVAGRNSLTLAVRGEGPLIHDACARRYVDARLADGRGALTPVIAEVVQEGTDVMCPTLTLQHAERKSMPA